MSGYIKEKYYLFRIPTDQSPIQDIDTILLKLYFSDIFIPGTIEYTAIRVYSDHSIRDGDAVSRRGFLIRNPQNIIFENLMKKWC